MGCRAQILITSFIILSFTVFTGSSYAEQQGSQPPPQTADTLDLAEFGSPVGSDELGTLSGGQSITIDSIDILANNMKLNGDMKGNRLTSNMTGMNLLSDDAFSNANGISTVVQNSGNQVIINNAFILNLRMQ